MVEVVLALTIALGSGQGAGGSSNLVAELALARRDGMCTTDAELRAKFTFSGNQNASPIYQKILALTKEDAKSRKAFSKLITLGRNPTPDQTKAVDKAVEDLAPVYALAEEAANRPHCSFVGKSWESTINFPMFAGLKGIAKSLAFRAQRRSARGDWRGALQDVRTITRIGRHAAEDPSSIGVLVGIAIDLVGERTFDEIIDRDSHDAAFLSAAERLSKDITTLPNLKHAVRGEYLQSLTLLSTPPTDAKTQALMVKVLRRWRAIYEALPEDPSRWQDAYPAARRIAREGVSDPTTKDLMPDYTPILDAVARKVARRHLSETGLRLLIYRSGTGHLPNLLPNYGPAGVDPFTGKGLKYQRKGAGLLLYSVGQDRIDNGGKDRPSGTANNAPGFDEILQIR